MEVGFMGEPFPFVLIRDEDGEIVLSPPEVVALMSFLTENVDKLLEMKKVWENIDEEKAIEMVAHKMGSQIGKPNRQQKRNEKRQRKRR